MAIDGIYVEPLTVPPPNRVGPSVQAPGALVLDALPEPEPPAVYPRTMPGYSEPQPEQDFMWQGGSGIVVNVYV